MSSYGRTLALVAVSATSAGVARADALPFVGDYSAGLDRLSRYVSTTGAWSDSSGHAIPDASLAWTLRWDQTGSSSRNDPTSIQRQLYQLSANRLWERLFCASPLKHAADQHRVPECCTIVEGRAMAEPI